MTEHLWRRYGAQIVFVAVIAAVSVALALTLLSRASV